MRRLWIAIIAVISVVVCAGLIVVGGCGGTSTGVGPGGDLRVDLPENPKATRPDAAKFGPIAAYLPPAGTMLTYRFTRIVFGDTGETVLKFVGYDNSTGSMVVESTVKRWDGPNVKKRWTLWIKRIGGQSYLWKRKCDWLNPRPFGPKTTVFQPGVLLGLFSWSPQTVRNSWTSTHNGVPEDEEPAIIVKYRGTSSITIGGTKYTARVNLIRFDKSFVDDIVGIRIYWVEGIGPVCAKIDPAALLVGTSRAVSPVIPLLWQKLLALQLAEVSLERTAP
ncbi:MAG: hypothetical protein ACUVX8_01275 [Candidatus Zipacnadales bacterium]